MDVAPQQPFGAMRTFNFTFTPGPPPAQATIKPNPPFKGVVGNDVPRPGDAPPVINASIKPQEYNRETRSSQPQASSTTHPSHSHSHGDNDPDNFNARVKQAAEKLVDERIATLLSATAEDRNMLERGLINHVNMRIEMLRASSEESVAKQLHDMNVYNQQRFQFNETHIEALNIGITIFNLLLSNVLIPPLTGTRDIQRAQGEFHPKTQAQTMQQKLRNGA